LISFGYMKVVAGVEDRGGTVCCMLGVAMIGESGGVGIKIGVFDVGGTTFGVWDGGIFVGTDAKSGLRYESDTVA
jgi:hypothetical protein